MSKTIISGAIGAILFYLLVSLYHWDMGWIGNISEWEGLKRLWIITMMALFAAMGVVLSLFTEKP